MLSYYELVLEVKLSNDIYFSKSYEMLSKFFNKAMLTDQYLKTLHKSKGYKYYSFSGMYPTETDGIYKKHKLYKIRMRSIDPGFICAMQFALEQIKDNNVTVWSIQLIKKHENFTTELITINPTIVTVNSTHGHWQINDDISILEKRLTENLLCKYNTFFNENISISDTFFYGLTIRNTKPITIPYKTGALLGNKLAIQVKEDDISQKLATIALGTGLGEKNSIGMGFCYGF